MPMLALIIAVPVLVMAFAIAIDRLITWTDPTRGSLR